jgi:hypothetical protein
VGAAAGPIDVGGDPAGHATTTTVVEAGSGDHGSHP